MRSNNILLFFNNDRCIWVAQWTLHHPRHHVVAFRSGSSCIKNNFILIARFHFRKFDACHTRHLCTDRELEISSCTDVPGSGIYNSPLNIKSITRLEECVIERSAADNVTVILVLGCSASTASTAYDRWRNHDKWSSSGKRYQCGSNHHFSRSGRRSVCGPGCFCLGILGGNRQCHGCCNLVRNLLGIFSGRLGLCGYTGCKDENYCHCREKNSTF